jgi:hypothetical protein
MADSPSPRDLSFSKPLCTFTPPLYLTTELDINHPFPRRGWYRRSYMTSHCIFQNVTCLPKAANIRRHQSSYHPESSRTTHGSDAAAFLASSQGSPIDCVPSGRYHPALLLAREVLRHWISRQRLGEKSATLDGCLFPSTLPHGC